MNTTVEERRAALEARYTANNDALSELMGDAEKEGSTFTAEQSERYDLLMGEQKSLRKQMERESEFQALQKEKAVAITNEGASSVEFASELRGGAIKVSRNIPKHWPFARYVGALAACHGNRMEAAEFARQRWTDTSPEVELALKAAVAAGTTTASTWALPLVQLQTLASEFIDILRPATVIGRIQNPSLRRVPFNIRVASKTTGSTVGWVGEGLVKPVSALAFSEVTLGFTKAAGIVVITEELARFSSPGAEDTITADLRDSMQQFLDTQFLDPTVTASTGVRPASITQGVTPIGLNAAASVATWTTAIQTALNAFATAGVEPTHWITTPAVALSLGMLRGTSDAFIFPGISATGGTLMGLQVVVSAAAPAGQLILIAAPEIYLADDGGVNVDVSREASVMMDSAPVDGTTAYTSLWQHNLVGIRAERFINWKKRRSGVVQMIDSTDVT